MRESVLSKLFRELVGTGRTRKNILFFGNILHD
jgi:hypothetical protein